MDIDPLHIAMLVATAILAAAGGVLTLAALQGPRHPGGGAGLFAEPRGAAVFLFDGETLVDATPEGRAILGSGAPRGGGAWARLQAWLHPRFPGFAAALARLPAEGRVDLSGAGDAAALRLAAELRGGLLRLAVNPADAAEGAPPLAEAGAREELDLLRRSAASLPVPIWREEAEGNVVWGNAAYIDLALARLPPGAELGWPLPRLFDRLAAAQGARDQRQRLADADGRGGRWYDLASVPDGTGRIVHALPADGAVQAETALRAFMQTLTKTFAHLRTGLAIFDEGRHLVLFNPALLDLTGLAPEMLTARPTLAAFLDGLRERSMIPEPRDWRAWRRQIVEMEDAAASGLYEEVWNLPTGQAYRVTGRPHPNGALALMIEDISTEVARSRRYREDLELGQAVIDAMEDAIAVFSQGGALVMSNAAYVTLWGHDPGATLGPAAGVAVLCDRWREGSAPTTVWDRAEDYVARLGPQPPWTDDVRLTDGRRLSCRCARLSGGATLMRFTPAPEAPARTAADVPVLHFSRARQGS
jgi:PAS domain-containing protein